MWQNHSLQTIFAVAPATDPAASPDDDFFHDDVE